MAVLGIFFSVFWGFFFYEFLTDLLVHLMVASVAFVAVPGQWFGVSWVDDSSIESVVFVAAPLVHFFFRGGVWCLW